MWTIFFLFLSDFAYDGLVRDHSLVRLFYLPFLSPRSVSRSEKPKFVCRGANSFLLLTFVGQFRHLLLFSFPKFSTVWTIKFLGQFYRRNLNQTKSPNI